MKTKAIQGTLRLQHEALSTILKLMHLPRCLSYRHQLKVTRLSGTILDRLWSDQGQYEVWTLCQGKATRSGIGTLWPWA